MIKTLVTASFATVSLIAVALPAQAANLPGLSDDSSYSASVDEDSLIQRLAAKGINVQSVEDWGGYVRAYVTKADGSTSMAIYDPVSLNQISAGATL